MTIRKDSHAQRKTNPTVLVEIYQALAQFFAAKSKDDLPAWLALPAVKWPIFEHIVLLAHDTGLDPYQKALQHSLIISRHPLHAIWDEHQEFISDKYSWLYESQHVYGRVPGPATFSVSDLYQRAGLENTSAELADYISLELAFLSYLAQEELNDPSEAQTWRTARKLFNKEHAGKWMPEVARQLIQSQIPRNQVMGMLLMGLTSEIKPIKNAAVMQYPSMQAAQDCSLCGFCVRVCPTQSMQVAEEEKISQLYFDLSRCIACGRCAEVCPSHVLKLEAIDKKEKYLKLFDSPRACCSTCGAYTVSEAELAFTREMLGEQAWLGLCNACKSELYGVVK